MISITERLRARHEPVGDGTGTWRPDGLCQEAADVIDVLQTALNAAMDHILDRKGTRAITNQICEALSKARGE